MNSAINIMSGARGATGSGPGVGELPGAASGKPGDSEFSRLVSQAGANGTAGINGTAGANGNAGEAGENAPAVEEPVPEGEKILLSGGDGKAGEAGEVWMAVSTQAMTTDEKDGPDTAMTDPGSAVEAMLDPAPGSPAFRGLPRAAELSNGVAVPERGGAPSDSSSAMMAMAGVVAAGEVAADTAPEQPVVAAGQPVTAVPDARNISPAQGILAGRGAELPVVQAVQPPRMPAGKVQPEVLNAASSIDARKPGSLMEKADADFKSMVENGQVAGKRAGQLNQAAVFANAFAGKPAFSAASAPGVVTGGDGASSAISFENTLHVAADKTMPVQNIVQNSIMEVRPGALPVNAVAIEMARQFRGGVNRFQIRMDPPELGRIDVRMHVTRDGNVSAHLVVEKPETLAALNRDAPALERALNTAGLNTEKNALNFSLSGGEHGFTNGDYGADAGFEENTGFMAGDESETMENRVEIRGYVSRSGVDIHV